MATKKSITEATVESKLKTLYNLQKILSEIDNIKTLRGELPLEVQDLEDEITGITTRLNKYEEKLATLQKDITYKSTSPYKSTMTYFRIRSNDTRRTKICRRKYLCSLVNPYISRRTVIFILTKGISKLNYEAAQFLQCFPWICIAVKKCTGSSV